MDKIPESNFIWSPDTEIERIAYTLAVIAEGFYTRKGFVVLPKVVSAYPQTCVVLPAVDFSLSPQEWQELALMSRDFPVAVPHHTCTQLRSLLDPYIRISPELTGIYRQAWGRVESGFWQTLRLYFPQEMKRIGSLEVRLTRFGTTGSFGDLSDAHNQRLVVYIRVDNNHMRLGSLAGVVILALVRYMEHSHGYTWTRRETIMDFLMSRPEMQRLFPDFQPMLFGLRRVPQTLKEESATYVAQLGIPTPHYLLDLVGTQISIKGVAVQEFGTHETLLIRELIQYRGEVVSFDRLADVLWGEGEFKTYWAINKLVQRLRTKLAKYGVPPTSIRTLRGRGYTLI